MPAPLFQPIIPLARTQLEDLVKNLDAELVLDCVSKKMFDNFSMWDLQLKKMQLNKEKGMKRLEVMLDDMENVLVELKKMVDNCLTHTKLCDTPAPSVTLGMDKGYQNSLLMTQTLATLIQGSIFFRDWGGHLPETITEFQKITVGLKRCQ